MSLFDGKSREQEAYEQGQDIGAHESPGWQAIHQMFAAMGSESEYEAWKAGFENGRDNQPDDDD